MFLPKLITGLELVFGSTELHHATLIEFDPLASCELSYGCNYGGRKK